tara:strand:- start:74 stop:244 length:171 start_codon:yes stop_codon:yes gene_type:complete
MSLVSQANTALPISQAPNNKISVGRFQRKISFAAVVLLIASMTKKSLVQIVSGYSN